MHNKINFFVLSSIFTSALSTLPIYNWLLTNFFYTLPLSRETYIFVAGLETNPKWSSKIVSSYVVIDKLYFFLLSLLSLSLTTEENKRLSRSQMFEREKSEW